MAKSEQDKLVDEWVALRNEHIGEIRIPQVGEYPPQANAFYGTIMNQYVTMDLIRHFCDGFGERNPLFLSEDYARKTKWGGIIAPVTFTDAIGQPYIGWEDHDEHPIRLKINRIRVLPDGSRRESFKVIRPGDKFRAVDRYLGMKEVPGNKVLRPAPAREFDETVLRQFINQREEVVATYERHFNMVCNQDWGKYPDYGWLKRREVTIEELKDIYRGYEEETRRGADTLYWEEVKVGEKIQLHKVGPYGTWDAAAVLTVLAGHAAAFDIQYEQFKVMRPPVGAIEPTTNPHFTDAGQGSREYTGGLAVGFYSQLEWLLGRMICNWMGDDGVLKMLDDRVPIYPILGDVFCCSGQVTNKRIDGEEYLVDLDVRCENLDGILLMPGTATVSLPSRTDNKINF
jgi:hypothetical protein